ADLNNIRRAGRIAPSIFTLISVRVAQTDLGLCDFRSSSDANEVAWCVANAETMQWLISVQPAGSWTVTIMTRTGCPARGLCF
ncbi:hypothetical protein, partial [Enterobacter hormaechei]|uniref:hypothetical protein n=1 Tax=Enterobacter hormaechei TaxID=158836 RepID=UPI0019532EEB